LYTVNTMIEKLIKIITSNGASDVHIASGRRPYIRVSGDLIELVSEPIYQTEDVVRLLVEFVGEQKGKRVINREEIDFSYMQGGIRVRGHSFVSSGRISLALRVVESVRSLEQLGLPSSLYTLMDRKQGFFLIVGPMGQGKSTTMAALIDYVNANRREHIVTIENPIEYMFDPKQSIVDQREIEVDTTDFASALRAAFRQDANVVMVGEMRDLETIETAVTVAETGHLVLSTLHTNSASQTIDRIIDMFPAERQNQIRAQLASSLLGIFSQRLIPVNGGGRKPAYELLINNTAVANLIREGRTHEIETVLQTHRDQGMIDLNTSLIQLVRSGQITIDVAMQYTSNQKDLAALI
jgi:twitching motility protein PilT